MSTTAGAPSLVALLRNTNTATLRHVLLQWSLQDVADALVQLPVADQATVLRALPPRAASAVFEYLSTPAQRALIPAMAPEDLAVLLNDMAPDDRTLFLSALPSYATRELLTLLSDDERAEAEKLLAYPADSVGRLMTPEYVAIREHWTIQDVLDHIREHAHDSETLNVLYVIDDRGVLIDDIRFRREDRTALPVVDDDGVLIGIVTVDDVLDAAQAMATRDLQRYGGSEVLGEPYHSDRNSRRPTSCARGGAGDARVYGDSMFDRGGGISGRLGHEAVPHPRFADEIPRLGGIRFELFAKLSDERPQVLRLLHCCRPPDLLEDGAMSQHAVVIAGQQRQELEFLWGQPNLGLSTQDSAAIVVNGQVSSPELTLLRIVLGYSAAQGDAYACQQLFRTKRLGYVVVRPEIESIDLVRFGSPG